VIVIINPLSRKFKIACPAFPRLTIPQVMIVFARLEMDKRPFDLYDKPRGRYQKVTLYAIRLRFFASKMAL